VNGPPCNTAGPAIGNGFPSVSILLLIKNHVEYMRRSLDLILGQEYQGQVEIVYVDSGSVDGTIELMRAHGVEPHCIPPEEFHHARTRNYAASIAQHEILALLSADAIPTNRQWLRGLVEPFRDPMVGGVYGKQIAPEGTGPVRTRGLESIYPDVREVRCLEPGTKGTIGMIRFSNANSAIRASVWRQFRFHEQVLVAEDHWICYKILKHGMKVVYEPAAAVIHGHERSLWGEFQWAVDNGISLKRMGVYDDPLFSGEFQYGWRRIKQDWVHFVSRGTYGLALKGFVVSGVKWAGVQVGKREKRLPRWLLRRVSAGLGKSST